LPLIVLNVVIHVIGLGLINERVVRVLSSVKDRRHFTGMLVVVMGAAAADPGACGGPPGEPEACSAFTVEQIAAFVAMRSQACAFSALLPKVNRPRFNPRPLSLPPSPCAGEHSSYSLTRR
jgi:hypothetical protein